MSQENLGSSIDDFLMEEGTLEEAQAHAVKEVVAWQLAEAMKKNKLSKDRVATLPRRAVRRWTACSTPRAISRSGACSERQP